MTITNVGHDIASDPGYPGFQTDTAGYRVYLDGNEVGLAVYASPSLGKVVVYDTDEKGRFLPLDMSFPPRFKELFGVVEVTHDDTPNPKRIAI